MRLRISVEPIGTARSALKELLLATDAGVDAPLAPRGRLRRRAPRALT
jgi:hypothetical protein